MFKKFISIILILLLFLVGCDMVGSIDDPNHENPSQNDKEDDPMINDPIIEKPELKGSPMAVGIWHRPNIMGNETNLQGIIDTLDTFQKCGINIVYLETIYHGMAMYKSNFLPYYNGFDGNTYGTYKDYLSAFVAEAKKRDIEVHAWVEDFFVGIESSKLTEAHPDWLLVTDKQATKQTEGNGYLFIDPANKDVRAFLLNVYYELLQKHSDIKGLNLDYIRYPVSSKTDDTGYTEAAMTDFLGTKGISYSSFEDGYRKIQLRYDDWVKYRAGVITDFVKSVRELVDKNFKNICLSTAVFPGAAESYTSKKQDFTTWLKEGYLDVVTPMAYYDNNSTFKSYLKQMVDSSNGTYCYTGVSCVYHNLSVQNVLEQIKISFELSDGFVIFGSQRLLNNTAYINALEQYFKDLEYHLPHLE